MDTNKEFGLLITQLMDIRATGQRLEQTRGTRTLDKDREEFTKLKGLCVQINANVHDLISRIPSDHIKAALREVLVNLRQVESLAELLEDTKGNQNAQTDISIATALKQQVHFMKNHLLETPGIDDRIKDVLKRSLK